MSDFPSITIGWLTNRWQSCFDWFVAGIVRELKSVEGVFNRDKVQVVAVDNKLWTDQSEDRKKKFKDLVADRFQFQHVSPKPSVWQGPNRLTQKDYFCAANSRNTVFAMAKGEHIIFVDDLSVLLPGWLSAHLHAAQHRYTLCGLTSKFIGVEIDYNGMLVKPRSINGGIIIDHNGHPLGIDSRLRYLDSDGVRDCAAEWLYGGTFSVPLQAALQVNGQDEIYNGLGGEDYDFGIRLGRAGWRICINRSCATIESEELHHIEPPVIRLDKAVSVDGPYSSNTLLNRLLRHTNSWTIGNHFNLADLRKAVLDGNPFPIMTEPQHHWVDGQPLREM